MALPVKNYYLSVFLRNRLFVCLRGLVVLFFLAFFFTWLKDLPVLLFSVLITIVIIDFTLLYRRQAIHLVTETADRLSNGDENEILLTVSNHYQFKVEGFVIDELPEQFQQRDMSLKISVQPGSQQILKYNLWPKKRGEYNFGKVHVYVSSPFGLLSRRYSFDLEREVKVYPSYLRLHRYQIMAASNRLIEAGIKKIRKIGQSQEFEHIKNYMPQDDFRSINWKATARRGSLMINSFTDEKAQQVYCVIDKSRVMKMPFDGMTLLDYAINASLILSSIAIAKTDKAGLITMSDKPGVVIPAENRAVQMGKILQALYREKSRYPELNPEALYTTIRSNIRHRALLFMFTNLESMNALERQLPFLKRIAQFHQLVVIFFENTGLSALGRSPAGSVEDIYIKTIAEKFAFEKRQIVMELQRHGITAMLTSPANLNVDVINKYLQIKARQGG